MGIMVKLVLVVLLFWCKWEGSLSIHRNAVQQSLSPFRGGVDKNGTASVDMLGESEVERQAKVVEIEKTLLEIQRQSVVIIFAFSKSSDKFSKAPWIMRHTNPISSQSGYIIEGRRILTVASVEESAPMNMVHKHGQSKYYHARRLATSYQTNLAMITVDDDEFWEGMVPLKFADEDPKLGDTIRNIYFTDDSDDIMSSEASVNHYVCDKYFFDRFSKYETSRIDTSPQPKLLRFYADNPMYSGSFGAPAINSNYEVVGTNGGPDFDYSYGYLFVPSSNAKHFIRDQALHGSDVVEFPLLGAYFLKILENPMASKYFGLDELENKLPKGVSPQGVLIRLANLPWFNRMRQQLHGSTTNTTTVNVGFKSDDILLQLNGHDVACDGTVVYSPTQDIDLQYSISKQFPGDVVDALVVRDGKLLRLEVPLSSEKANMRMPANTAGQKSRFFFYGGLVFVPLTTDLIGIGYSGFKHMEALEDIRYSERDDDEIVILRMVVPTPLTVGYNFDRVVVESVNSIEIRNLKHLVYLVENSEKEIVEFELEDRWQVFMNSTEVAQQSASILDKHRIPFDRRLEKTPRT